MHNRLLLLLLLAVIVWPTLAQNPHSLPAVQFPPGVTPLAQGWRTKAGDNLAWAQPGFDDSTWQPANLSAEGPLPGGRRWYRIRFRLNPGQASTALLLDAPGGSFEIWIDGQRVPAFSILPALRMSTNRACVVPLPSHGGPTFIAVRVFYPAFLADSYGGTLNASLAGIDSAKAAALSDLDSRVMVFLPTALFNAAIAVAGIGALLLFFAQRARPEYLWLALYFILLAASTVLWRAIDNALLPIGANSLIGDPIFYPVLACQIEFSFAFIDCKVSRGWRLCEVALFGAMLLAFFNAAGHFSPSMYFSLEAILSFIVGFGLLALLLVQRRRGNREAGWLILPSLLPAASVAISDAGTVALALGFKEFNLYQGPIIHVGRVLFTFVDLANIGFLLAIGALLLFRFLRVTRQQARAAAELEAAQRVQALLLRRSHNDDGPLRIDAVYLPSQEVGGDFFHTVQIGDATRVVVGDVSGKGMGAAMLVSVILGALDGIAVAEPSALLHHLNAILLARQQGGFATCVCALLAESRAVTFANAGHLSPYRNGEEIALDSGLPLGIAADVEYTETKLQLDPGDRITFLSDGVVEAQSPSGELFGFERTAAISAQSAETIARAAQQFGQEDDITVLTLAFSPAEVMHA
jgi:sigma-B regulation protein RsbU (phosphoserine phosphatase)